MPKSRNAVVFIAMIINLISCRDFPDTDGPCLVITHPTRITYVENFFFSRWT
ncbi:hypothetical protein O9929_11235 [Vibrio lentus]|nr:hypothetical protein [Vibrio lentus]